MSGNERLAMARGRADTGGSGVSIEVRNLSVGSLSREHLTFGDTSGLVEFSEARADDIRAVVWNEGEIRLVMNDRSTEVVFRPEVYPETDMFLSREHKREKNGYGGPSGNRVWQGEYEPVLFAKKDLLKFLAAHTTGGDEGVLASIKNLRVTKHRDESEEMLDPETDDVRRVETETESTNIPRHFSLTMPVSEDVDAVFEFEACLYKPDDEDPYQVRREAQHKRIAVRAVNARPVLRGLMKDILKRLPARVPRYYGRFGFVDSKVQS